MISRANLNAIRAKLNKQPYIWLVDLFDKDDNIIQRMTNFEKDFLYKRNRYLEFPFLVILPESVADAQSSKTLELLVANFPTKNIENIKSILKGSVKITFHFINKEFPDDNYFESSTYYHAKDDFLSYDELSIRISFSRKSIQDKGYPFRTYNSRQHASLYQDYKEATFK